MVRDTGLGSASDTFLFSIEVYTRYFAFGVIFGENDAMESAGSSLEVLRGKHLGPS